MRTLTKSIRDEYTQLFNNAETSAKNKSETGRIISRILNSRPRYENVAHTTGVPWYFIAITHQMESSGSFTSHLHNGDSLKSRTVQVPRNRPVKGIPPFTWEESAIDAMMYKGFATYGCWSLSALLYRFEKYNGFGYRRRGIPSPYLWSYSQHYKSGKFVQDGIFSLNAVSKQCGAAILLKELQLAGEIIQGEPDNGLTRLFNGTTDLRKFNIQARDLQMLLNEFGYNLNPDGFAGKITAAAYKDFTGSALSLG